MPTSSTCVAVIVGGAVPVGASTAGWSQQGVPLPVDAQYDGLNAVSCPSASHCTAVGWYQIPAGGFQLGLVESWNGNNWSVQANPSGNNSNNSDLTGVACATAKSCVAVGTVVNSSSDSDVFLAERWNGSTWTTAPVPQPVGMTSGWLNAVACPSAVDCFAVGTFSTGSGGYLTVIEDWNGSSWARQPGPSAAGILFGIACLSTSNCFTVGAATGGASWDVLAEHWNGTVWTAQSTPALPAFEGNTPGNAWLDGVSCSGAKCAAVGTIEYDGGLMSQTLAERWDSKKWVIQATPDPGGGYNNNLAAVSCTSAADCTAVGLYFDSYTGANGKPFNLMVMRWNGARWTEQGITDPSGGTGSWLHGVACKTVCTAVGGYNTIAGGFALAEGNCEGSLTTTASSAHPHSGSFSTRRHRCR